MAVLGQSGLHEAAWADKIGGAAQQPHAADEARLEWSLAADAGVVLAAWNGLMIAAHARATRSNLDCFVASPPPTGEIRWSAHGMG